ncbi:platelet-activating factor receptor [Denticeps clupeoides]|uniref:platelet-activating factor receptor n=1 Tax=Denticeps clupeoides TaxID=299321 RepID=UPI0010A4DC31|nr:platelet-activating factor receptor [Denticeps clupeoides]
MENSSARREFLDSKFRYILFPIFYSVVFCLGLVFNLYVLFVLRHLREARAMNEVRIYMTNLTVADFLFVAALPFWIDYYLREGQWVSGDVLCRIASALFFINTYCSILFLAVISMNRYWAVTRPLHAASTDHWKRGAVVSTCIWAFTLMASMHTLVTPGIPENGETKRCLEGYYNETYEVKRSVVAYNFVIVVLFCLVFFLVVVCNILIAQALMKQPLVQKRSELRVKLSAGPRPGGTKRRAVRMLCAVVTVFVVCFLPHHLVQGPWTLAVLGMVDWSQATRQHLNDAHQITMMLMGLNCLLDPVVYCFATRKFRQYIVHHLQRLGRNKGCSRNTVSTSISMGKRNQSILSKNDDNLGNKIH